MSSRSGTVTARWMRRQYGEARSLSTRFLQPTTCLVPLEAAFSTTTSAVHRQQEERHLPNHHRRHIHRSSPFRRGRSFSTNSLAAAAAAAVDSQNAQPLLQRQHQRQQQHEEDFKNLFHTLRAVSAAMPKQLMAVHGSNSNDSTTNYEPFLESASANLSGSAAAPYTSTTTSPPLPSVAASPWKDAAVFHGYREGRIETKTTSSSSSTSTSSSSSWKSRYLGNSGGDLAAAVEMNLEDEESDDELNSSHDDGEESEQEKIAANHTVWNERHYSHVPTENSLGQSEASSAVAKAFRDLGDKEKRIDLSSEAVAAAPSIAEVAEDMDVVKQLDLSPNTEGSDLITNVLDESANIDPTTTTQNDADDAEHTDPESLFLQKLEAQFAAAVHERRLALSMELFETATVLHGVDLDLGVVIDFFYLLSHSRPFHGYQVMQYILEHRTNASNVLFRTKPSADADEKDFELGSNSGEHTTSDNETSTESTDTSDKKAFVADANLVSRLYRQMCYSVKSLDPAVHRHADIRALVSSLSAELKQLDKESQKNCLPVFVASLLQQRSQAVGKWAGKFYHKMVELELELPPKYFEHLLMQSKFQRSGDLPYHDVLRQVVLGGVRPMPQIVMNAVDNMFPYANNVKGAYIALDCVMELQRQSFQMAAEQNEKRDSLIEEMQQETDEAKFQELEKELNSLQPPSFYPIDLASLECMSSAASSKSYADLILLIWDALDLMGLEATEAIYENTVICFASIENLSENCFVVLKDMEDRGFTPSSALIRGAAYKLRYA